MTKVTHKEAHRVFWMVKGHFDCTTKVIFESYESYFKRLWGNHEAVYREEGFEEAYEKLMNTNTYTQREWDRTVGWGVVPEEYKK